MEDLLVKGMTKITKVEPKSVKKKISMIYIYIEMIRQNTMIIKYFIPINRLE